MRRDGVVLREALAFMGGYHRAAIPGSNQSTKHLALSTKHKVTELELFGVHAASILSDRGP